VICGHCHEGGKDVAHVRDCSGVGAATALSERPVSFREYSLGGPLARQKARLGAAKAKLPSLTRFRAAVEVDDPDRPGEKVTKFYVVAQPDRGRWAGHVFLDAQASDETWPVKNVDTKLRVLEAIAEDPLAAMLLYTEKLGRCANCGRTLTAKPSLALSVGPICARKMGLTA
jgi:hypothetical protein